MQRPLDRLLAFLRRHPRLEVAALGFLPGSLLGAHVAGLLFFLNPDLPFSAGPVLRGVLFYGVLLGLPGSLAMLILARGSRRRALRLLPWGLTLALALAAVLDWTHASRFSFYLPPGINRRLIRAALWLSLAALVTFYTSLLHSLGRRRYGRRSRLGFVALCLVSLLVTAERRAAFRPALPPVRASVPRPVLEPARLIVVGLEGATLDALLPLAEQGRVPFLASLMRSGVTARVAPVVPNRRLAAWTSLATGKHPYHHEVMGAYRYPAPVLGPDLELRLLPAGVGFARWGLFGITPRPVENGDQKVLSLWQILSRRGMSSGVVGWPAPNAVDGETRYALAEGFFEGEAAGTEARPEAIAERARLFQLELDELDPVALGRFGDDPPETVRRALAADGWRQGLCLFLLDQQPRTEALFVHLPGLAMVSARYAGAFEEAQLEGSEDPGKQQAAELLAAYYRHVDGFLQQLWERESGRSLLAVVSPVGFAKARGPHGLWRRVIGADPLAGTTRAAPDGVLLLHGERVSEGVRLAEISILDLVPTLLYGLGYPVARDLDGKVLNAAFDPQWRSRQPLSFVPSYENLPPVASP